MVFREYKVKAETTAPSGRPVRMCRMVMANSPEAAMLAAVGCRRDNGAPFVGCVVQAESLTGKEERILEEQFGQYKLDPV